MKNLSNVQELAKRHIRQAHKMIYLNYCTWWGFPLIATKWFSLCLQMVVVVYIVLWFLLVSRIVNCQPIYTIFSANYAVFNNDFNCPIIFSRGLVYESWPNKLSKIVFYKTLLVCWDTNICFKVVMGQKWKIFIISGINHLQLYNVIN